METSVVTNENALKADRSKLRCGVWCEVITLFPHYLALLYPILSYPILSYPNPIYRFLT